MRIRNSARVVLLNDRDEVFLFRHTGKRRSYWILPGGGVEEGETWEEAAIREMWEETGISGVPLGPLLWTREKATRLNDEDIVGQERYYLVRCGNREISDANQLDYERAHYTVRRWWNVESIRHSRETIYPVALARLLEPVIAGELSPVPLRLTE